MTKKFIQERKKELEIEKEKLEKQLSSFAKKSKKTKGDWQAKMPSYNGGSLEEEADEVEEYSTRLALEKTLEEELRNVDLALEKTKKGQYGTCEKCKKSISQERLKVYPQARHCKKCKS